MTKEKFSSIKIDELKKHVQHVVDVVAKSLENQEKKFYKNSVDPFSALFDAMLQDITITDWIKQEKSRQNQKTLQNAMGDFHQKVLGSVPGWKDLGVGSVIDIVNHKKKIIAEIKNKHNTTKGNHKVVIYDDLKDQLDKDYKGYTAYYVEIIPKNKKIYNLPFTPPDNRTHARRTHNDKIRVIDGKSFYQLATGDPDALKKVYQLLFALIAECMEEAPKVFKNNKEYMDLFNRVY